MSRSESAVSGARYRVPSLDRALSILELVAREPRGLIVSEVARRLQLPKNAAFRIMVTLHARGYLERDPLSKAYRLSRRLLSLAYMAIDEHNLIEKSLDVMRQLRDQTGETALIGTLGYDHGLVLEQVPSSHPVKCLVAIGHRFPLHTAAPGKALLAFLPEQERQAYLERIPFTRFNERTITDPEQFAQELAEVRRRGFAVDRGEELEGLHCVAAPIFNHRGYPLASIWITGPAERLRLELFDPMASYVMEAAAEISRRFGYRLL